MHKAYAVIGPPGSGKSTVLKALLQYPGVVSIVSHTTRKPHPGEQDGVHYYFVSREVFAKLTLVERVSYSGEYYGLSKEEVLRKMEAHPVSFVDIDVDGYQQLKKMLAGRLESIYILVDKETILTRYISEGRSDAEIRQRIAYAESQGEFNNWQVADHVVKNTGDLVVTIRQILAITNLVKCDDPIFRE